MYNETEFTYAAVEGHDPRSLIRSIINPPLQDHFNYITNWGHSIVPMGTSAGGNSIGYDSVFVRKKNQQGLTTGSSTFSYINYVEEPYGIFFPGVPNIKKLNNGQLLKEEYFNNNGIKVKAKEITYTEELSTSKKVNGIITKTPVCEYLDPADLVSIDEVIFARIYNDNSQWFYPSREVDITYDVKGLNPVYDTTIYEYNNSEHKQLSKKTKISSEGKKIVQKFKYPSDFTNLPSTTDSYDDIEVRGLKAMVDNNIQIKPIETIKLVNDSITGGNINTFILNKYNHIVPYSKLILETKDSRPIDDDNPNNLWMFNQTYLDYENGQWLFKEDDLYPADDAPNYLYHYDQNGNLVQVDKKDDITTSYIWGYNNEYPIAKIKNAKDSSWYFDGFESGTFDENIGWDHHGAGDRVVTDEASHTGKYSVKFTDANSWSGVYLNSPYIKVTPGEQYTISAWFKCDETKYAYINWYDFTNGVSHTKTKQGTGKWTYIEHTYTVPSNCKELRVYLYGHHTNSNTIYYDDIRVYPDNSQMNTYTYDPLIGITSKTDQSNNTTFYFYDEFGRLKTIKDNDLNIIKDFDYQYGNQ
jgi:YD repeat-containing protein